MSIQGFDRVDGVVHYFHPEQHSFFNIEADSPEELIHKVKRQGVIMAAAIDAKADNKDIVELVREYSKL